MKIKGIMVSLLAAVAVIGCESDGPENMERAMVTGAQIARTVLHTSTETGKITCDYSYDEKGRLGSIDRTFDDGSTDGYVYEYAGTTYSVKHGAFTYSFDSQTTPTKCVYQAGDMDPVEIKMGYNGNRIASIDWPNGTVYHYDFDSKGNMTTVELYKEEELVTKVNYSFTDIKNNFNVPVPGLLYPGYHATDFSYIPFGNIPSKHLVSDSFSYERNSKGDISKILKEGTVYLEIYYSYDIVK